VQLPDSVHLLARLASDEGAVAPDLELTGIVLAFQQSPAQKADLTALLDELQDPNSPQFHKWLTPTEFGARFGLTDHDLNAITTWLQGEGLVVTRISNSRTRVFISAQAKEVERVFHTRIHRFLLRGDEHFANTVPVEVPRAFADMVLHVGGLTDFTTPKPPHRSSQVPTPNYNYSIGSHAIAPSDFATIYDINGLYTNSTVLDGTGASLAVVGQTSITTDDLTNFRTAAGLTASNVVMHFVSGSGSSTYYSSGDAQESTLDLEWSGAVARNATINFVYTGNGSGWNVWNAIEQVADNPSTYGNPTVVSISYGYCEPLTGASFRSSLENAFQQGNTNGMTFVVATGDSGAAGCDLQEEGAFADAGLAIQIPGDFPEATAAGGTEFSEGSGTYWSTSNGTNSLSALSYIPETSWNDSSPGGGLASSNGGASIFYAKPSWQTGIGVPADGWRDTPDIAMTASWDHDAYLLCITTGGTQYCAPGNGWSSTGGYIWLEGGTSAAAPTFSGLVTILSQSFGTGLGNINSTLYSLSTSQPSVFHDITSGNNIVPCNPGSTSCGCPSGVPGCTSGQNQFGYSAGVGYDQVTGLGSVDAYNMWKYWPTTTTTSISPNSTTAVIGETLTIASAVATNRIGPAITGNVAFDDSATQLSNPSVTSTANGSGIVSGSATLASSSLGIGTHTLSAIYSGDSTYKTSTSASTTVTITSGITVSPSNSMVAEGGSINFSASGGVGPYGSWSVTSTSGSSIVAGTGVYTAGNTPGTDTVHVLDSQNYSGSTTVTIVTPIAISPTSTSGEVGIGTTLAASNGQPATYQWSIKTNNSHGALGSNCITGSASCTYTPGTTSGVTDTIQVADALGESSSGTVAVAATLGASPSSASMGAGSTYSGFAATGGVSPYTWSISPTGQGVSINSSTGAVTATGGATTGSYTVLLADALNVHATAGLTVNAALTVTPASASLDIGGSVTLHASNGSGSGYAWAIGTNSSVGSLGANCTPGSTSCTWTAGNTSGGTDVINLHDGNGVLVTASITISPKPVVSPASSATDTGIATVLTASSGSGSGYAWTVMTNGSSGSLGSNCTVGSTTCTWTTGPTASTTDKVLLTDGNGGTTTATITVNPSLVVSPAAKTTDANVAVSLTASGGSSSGYTWSIGSSGSGGSLGANCTVGSSSCMWTTGASAGTDTVKLADSTGKTVTSTITVDAALVMTPSTKTTDAHQAVGLTISGGSGSNYTWAIVTNSSSGTLGGNCTTGSTSCTWTTGATSGGTDIVKATDANGVIATASITVNPTLVVSPASKTTDASFPVTLTASGGSGSGYTWTTGTIHSGGSLGANCTAGSTTCTWMTGATSGNTDTINLTDGNGVTVASTITVAAALVVSPANTGTDISHAVTLTVSGGSGSGYMWSIGTNTSSGSLGSNCTTGSTTCTWNAGTTSGGIDRVNVTDGNSDTVTASITISPALVVSPASTTADTAQAVTLTASAGSGSGYKWTINTNGSSGSLGSNCTTGSTTCTWNTGATGSTTDKIQLADGNNVTTLATVAVNAVLAVAPTTKTTDENVGITLTASGGAGGYQWAIGSSGSGGALGLNCTTGSATCTWTTGGSTGTDTITVTDSLSRSVTSTITVDPALVISPSSKTTDAKAATTLTVSGGLGSGYTWAIGTNSSGGALGGNCSSGSTTCTWTAGSTSGGTDIIKVTDGNSVSVTASLTINSALVIAPTSKTTDAGATVSLTASAGSGGGYTWTIGNNHSGGSLGSNCTVGSTTCTWNAGSTTGSGDVIDLTDGNGVTVTSSITVNAALVVSPSSTATDVNHSVSLTASGGSGSGYTWTIGTNSSGGSLGSNCTAGSTACTWNAGNTPGGQDIVNLTDSNGVTVTATIAVGPQLIVSPASSAVDTAQTVSLTASGGSGGGYKWAINTNGSSGSLGANCTNGSTACTWTTGATGSTTDKVQLTDGNSVNVLATITVNPLLTISPASKTTDETASVTLTASGGSGTGFTWAIGMNGSSGSLGSNCTIGSSTCTWTTGSSTGTDTVNVADSLGKTVTASISVDPLLVVTPASRTIDAKEPITLTASGGLGSGYTWSMGTNSSGGSLGANCTAGSTTCTWTAGSTSGGTDVVKVTDGNGVATSSTLTIVSALVVSPATKTTDTGGSVTLTASAGSGSGYTWTVNTSHSGGSLGANCTAGSTTCTWTAGATSGGNDIITVTDSNGGTANATITVDATLVVSPASTGVDVNNSVTLTASGGSGSGYTWTIGTNSSSGALGANCTAGSTSCTWTAGMTSGGNDIVNLTDANSITVSATITIGSQLIVAPSSSTLDTGQTVTLTASGGSHLLYHWTIGTNGSGGSLGSNCTLSSTTCTWTVGSTGSTTDRVVLGDSFNGSATATITVNSVLTVTPASKTTDEGVAVTLTASGGSGTGYTWAINMSGSGGGLGANCLAGGATCTWTAGMSTGTDTINLTDSLNKTTTATITVNPALVVAPSSKVTDAKASTLLTVSGGSGSGYSWTIGTNSSSGSLSGCSTGSTTCTWVAGSTSGGTDVIKVTDGNGVTVASSITINPALVIAPLTRTTDAGAAVSLTASGGSGGGYAWAIGTNRSGGSLGANCTTGSTTCTWTTGATSGMNDTINLTDGNGVTVTATITVNPALVVSPASTATDATASVALTASGGAGSGYTWAIGTNSSNGSLGANCIAGGAACTWTAGSTSGGTDTVKLTDGNGVTVLASITIAPLLVVSPATTALDTVETVTLTASGGSGSGYKWAISTNGSNGSLGANCTSGSTTCTWNTGSTASTTDKVQLTDGNNVSTLATITVNPVLAVAPASKTTDATNTVTLTASGGSGTSYTWTVGSSGSGGSLGGNCTVGSATCTWSTGSSSGTDTIRLSDSTGKTVTSTITVNPQLIVVPASKTTDAKATVTLTVSGGSGGGYVWAIGTSSSGGSLGANCTTGSTTCTWTVGSASGGTDTIKVTDGIGITVISTLTINPALVVAPLNSTTEPGYSVSLTASGGSGGGYSWTIGANGSGGSLGSSCSNPGSTTCTWTAGSTGNKTDTVQLTDGNGVTVVATITVDPALTIAPIGPYATPGQMLTFTGSGGSGTGYTFSFVTGDNLSGGSLTAGGAYTAGSTSNVTDTVQVKDSLGFATPTTITVEPPIIITPAAPAARPGLQISFTATGGSGSGYTWSYPTGGNKSGGSLTSGGVYTGGSTTGVTDTVLVTDGKGGTGTTTITVYTAVVIAPANPTTTSGGALSFTASGGSGSGYTFGFATGGNLSGGMISAGGSYLAGNGNGVVDTVQARDSVGLIGTTTITVDPQIVITPTAPTTVTGGAITFTATGGSGSGYSWSYPTGGNKSGGSLSSGGAYVAGSTSGVTDTVQVRDSAGNVLTTTVVVDPKIVIVPSNPVVLSGAQQQFTATGGSGGGYTWAYATGGDNSNGQITPAGLYTGGTTSGVTDTIKVSDSAGNVQTTTVIVHPPIVISPNAPTKLVGQQVLFSATGGSGSGYTWAYVSGGNKSGGSLTTAGLYTAGATSGVTDTIQVTDSSLSTATTNVVVDPTLTISPTSKTVAVTNTVVLTSTGGGGGNTWSILPNNSGASFTGSCNGLSTCTYKAGNTSGASDTVKVTDAFGNAVSSIITVNPPVVVSPSTLNLAVGNTFTFTASGGVGTLTWSISPNSSGASFTGSCNGLTSCTYKAGTTGGTVDSVVVSDTLGNTSTAVVTVHPALGITPSVATVAVTDTLVLTATGGVGPFNWTIVANGSNPTLQGSCTGVSSCTYQAGTNSGTDAVKVVDSLNNTSTITITVNPGLGLSPPATTVAAGDMIQFFASGGVPPLMWSITPNGSGASFQGTCNGTYSCVYTAGPTGNTTDTVLITDARNNMFSTVVTVKPALSISPGSMTVAVRDTLLLTASGGVGALTWNISSNGSGASFQGSCSGLTSCTYVAGSVGNKTDTVTVTDSLNNTAVAVIAVNPSIGLSPASMTVATGDTVPFTATGGVPPLTWTVSMNHSGAAGLGACAGKASCSYVAGPTGNTTDVVTVTDSLNNTASATVTVNLALSLSPTIDATEIQSMVSLTAAGGVAPLSWTISTNMSGAYFQSSCTGLTTCTYVAGPTGNTTDIVTVTDAENHTASSTITVASGITLTPASITLVTGDSHQFTIVGGASPFSWSVVNPSGGAFSGTCGTSCVYIVGTTSGVTDTISVLDSLGHGATARITVDPTLTISPVTDTVAAGDAVPLTSTGGVGPIGWAISTNSSSAYFSTPCGTNSSCVYVAGPTGNEVDTVTVTDSLGHTAASTITVHPALAISPTAYTLAVGNSTSFTATGGVGTYAWNITTNHSNASLPMPCTGNSSCTYMAGGVSGGADILTLGDGLGHSATATITVDAALTISPTAKAVDVGDTVTFTAAGGAGISSWTISHNVSGSTFPSPCNQATTCTWKAGTTSGGTDTVTVTDIRGNTASALVTVNAALGLSPTVLTVSSGDVTTFTATGGVSPLVWSISPNKSGATFPSPCGSNTTCAVMAGPTSGMADTITVQDAQNHSVSATVTVNAKLTINPTSSTLATGNTQLFTASGGVGTLTWTISPNTTGATFQGSCNGSTTCTYKAGSTGGTDTVIVSDTASHSASATVAVGGPLALSPTSTTVSSGDVVPFTASGGAGGYTWTISTNLSNATLGSSCISGSSSCSYTAGSTSGHTDVVTVKDMLNNTATAMITVNAALTLAPVSTTVAAGDTWTFTAAGGVGTLSWTISPNGSGATFPISCAGNTQCQYKAGALGGTTDTVVVSDTLHHTASSVVTVNNALAVGPVNTTVAVQDSVTITASGGVGALTWMSQNNSGGYFQSSCTGLSTCTWVTGTGSGVTDVITVTDSLNNTATSHITVNPALTIAPTAKTVTTGDTVTFTAMGGSSSPNWSIVPNNSGASFLGSCNGKTSCTYAAGTKSGTVDTVVVTDSISNTASAIVTVVPALAVSPTSATVATGNTVALTATGGVGSPTWSISPNHSGATLTCSDSTHCSYVAGTNANQADTVVVADTIGNQVTSVITVHAQPSLSPASGAVVVGDTVQVTASGGVGTFTWSLSAPSGGSFSGSCPVGAMTCTYQAGMVSGATDTITVTDSLNNKVTASFIVHPALALAPGQSTVAVSDTVTFTASGGTGGFVWTIPSNNSNASFLGSCAGNSTCQYKAGTTGSTLDTVTVTDSGGHTASALVTVNQALAISPVAKIVAVGNRITFNSSGGVGAVNWAISSNNSGAIFTTSCTGSSCVYQAGTTANRVDTVTVTDSLNNTASATVTVNAALTATPAASTVVSGNQVVLTAAGGVSTLTWSISPNRSNATFVGVCNGRTTCTYQAGNTNGVTDTINVTDSLGNAAHATVTVDAPLVLTPTTATMYQSGSVSFSTTGGVPPLSWTIPMDNSGSSLSLSCSGSASCTYTAGAAGGTTDVVAVTDARGNTQNATVTVVATLAVSPQTVTLAPNQPVVLSTNGTGAAPFTWSLDAGATGSLNTISGSSVTYTAGSTPDTQDTVTVIDQLGEIATVTITVGNDVSISPLTPTIVAGASETFHAFGGDTAGGYTWSVISATPVGYFAGNVYTSTAAGTDTIQASDDLGNTATTTITVVPALTITPASPISVAPRQKVTLDTQQTGLGPYNWSLEASPSGSLNASTGSSVTYTAGTAPNSTDVVTITDALNETVTVTIRVGAALTLAPLNKTILSGTTQTFTATGGDSVDGYTWTILNASPVGHFTGNIYTAGSAGGTDTVQVSDADGNSASTTITVDPRLVITPASPVQLAPRQQVTLNSQGTGAAPLAWSLEANPIGSLSASTGSSVKYTAAATPSVQDTVTVRDTLGEVVNVVLNVGPSVSVAPLAPLVFTNQTTHFTATGGDSVDGYTWSITNPTPAGSISASGVYTAGAAAGTDTIHVTDSLGNSATTTVTVVVPLSVTPPSPVSVAPRQQVTFQTSSTGLAPWSWSLRTPADGTISSGSGASVTYTAGTTPNQQDLLTVSDSDSEAVPITISIGPGVSLGPQTPTILVNATQTFTATGGYAIGGYVWSITNANPVGTLSSGLYTAGSSPGTDTVQVKDALGNIATTTITVRAKLTVTPSSPVSVAPRQAVAFSTGSTGIGPYRWFFGTSPQGSLSATSGTNVTYTAGTTPNTSDSIVITDAANEMVTIAVSIGPGITINPASPAIATLGTQQFSATGGAGSGYTWTITNASPVGSLSGSLYTAGSTAGTDTIQVQDQLGNVATTTIAVVMRLAVTPPSPVQVAPGAIVVFNTSSTGRGPYHWSLGSSPAGSLNSSSGSSVTYTAGSVPNTADTITVTDALSENVAIAVTIGSPISVTPAASVIVITKTQTFTATGGNSTGGYRWSITNANPVGFMTGNVYSAGFGTGTDTIQAKDAFGSAGATTITVVPKLAVTPASPIALAPRAAITLQTNGTGVAPILWSLGANATGSLSASSGASVTYTAGATPNSQDTVTATDSAHETVSIVVNVGVALTISPTAPTIAAGGTQAFTANGGDSVHGYTWSITNANPVGTITNAGGYTAGSSAGTDTVQVMDDVGNVATTTITVVPDLALTPASPISVAPRQAITLDTTGTGLGPYSWSLGGAPNGALSPTAGASVTYTAGTTPNASDVVTVRDALSESASVTINIGAGVALTTPPATIITGGVQTYAATGGYSQGGYTWSVTSPTPFGSFSGSTYTAGAVPGVDTIKVVDSLGNAATTTITVVAPLSVSPPSPVTLAPLEAVSFTSAGGEGPFHWSLVSDTSGGALTGTTFTAGATGNTQATVSVSDSLGEVVSISITVGAGVSIMPATPAVLTGAQVMFTAQGGIGQPYRWSIPPAENGSGGSIGAATGDYTAGPLGATVDTIQVVDGLGNVATTQVTVELQLAITPSAETVLPETVIPFSVTGGSGVGYSWSFLSDNSVTGSSITAGGSYQAGPNPGIDTVLVVDSQNNSATTTVTIVPHLQVTPTSPIKVPPRGSVTFTSTGGEAPIQWMLTKNGSNATLSSSVYTAGPDPDTQDMVTVTDALQETATITINVGDGISITPSTATAIAGTTLPAFTAAGGNGAPYTWSIVTNANRSGAHIDPQTGVYTAGPVANVTDIVEALDSLGNGGTVSVMVVPVPATDAGIPPVDAGSDAGPSADGGQDAGLVDAGDAGTDGGAADAGADAGSDAGPGDAGDGGESADAAIDAGSDAGMVDGGDAGEVADAGDAGEMSDAGEPLADAGSTPQLDAGMQEPVSDAGTGPHPKGGCACGPGDFGGDSFVELLLLPIALLLRRRRARMLRG
jgi:hypothetical protein